MPASGSTSTAAQIAVTPSIVTAVELPTGFDLLDLHRLAPERYPFLLESPGGTTAQAHFDILFAFPGETLRLDENWKLSGDHAGQFTEFLTALDSWWASESAERQHESLTGSSAAAKSSLPFQGGWFIFLAYELVRETEPTISSAALPGFPVALAVRIPVALIRCRQSGHTWLLAEPGQEPAVAQISADIDTATRTRQQSSDRTANFTDCIAEPDPQEFLAAVERARELITAGDVFQVNLARRWTGRLHAGIDAWQIYHRLREVNPAPFSGFAKFGACAIVSSSPERLVRASNGYIETRPIAGTRPRASTAAPEEGWRQALLSNAKERAEHVMLIDLERNDLGRVCVPGTIAVNELMTVESYAHVHHIVSNIRGELRADVTPGMLIRAVFPGGTITGCPKVRCMEIIHDLEAQPRGPYTGAMGYLNLDGSCDFNILIRTIQVCGKEFSLSAGSGIVADSIAERELEETRAKAKGMLLALQS